MHWTIFIGKLKNIPKNYLHHRSLITSPNIGSYSTTDSPDTWHYQPSGNRVCVSGHSRSLIPESFPLWTGLPQPKSMRSPVPFTAGFLSAFLILFFFLDLIISYDLENQLISTFFPSSPFLWNHLWFSTRTLSSMPKRKRGKSTHSTTPSLIPSISLGYTLQMDPCQPGWPKPTSGLETHQLPSETEISKDVLVSKFMHTIVLENVGMCHHPTSLKHWHSLHGEGSDLHSGNVETTKAVMWYVLVMPTARISVEEFGNSPRKNSECTYFVKTSMFGGMADR